MTRVVVMTDRSEALVPALRRFQDAVSALIDPQREMLDGRTMWVDSPYSQLYDSLAGQQGYASDWNPRSMPLLWVDAHDCLARIDQTVASWPLDQLVEFSDPRTPPTVRRLQAFSDAKWRPQDTDLLTDRAGQLEAFAKTIKSLLLPEINIALYGHACPICGQTSVRRTDVTGAAMTVPALSIRGDSALCAECKAVWDYTRLPMLGRMLGLQPTAVIGDGS